MEAEIHFSGPVFGRICTKKRQFAGLGTLKKGNLGAFYNIRGEQGVVCFCVGRR